MGKEASILNRGSNSGSANSNAYKKSSMNEMSFSVQQLCKELSQSVAGGSFDSKAWLDHLNKYVSDFWFVRQRILQLHNKLRFRFEPSNESKKKWAAIHLV